MNEPAAVRPLSHSLNLVAREVTDLAELGDQLQALILRLMIPGQHDPAALIEAQAADLLSQRLSGLAAFIRALADAAPDDVTADIDKALRVLTLAEQARRLSSPAPAPEAAELMTFWD